MANRMSFNKLRTLDSNLKYSLVPLDKLGAFASLFVSDKTP